MKLRLPHIAVLSTFLGLSACVTPLPEHVALAPAAHDSIASTEVVMPIQQSEIYILVPASQVGAATGGGLLGALIDASVDSSRAKKSEAAIKPLRDALVDLDVDATLREDLTTSLGQVPWLHAGKTRVVKDVTQKNLDKVVTDSKDSAVLVVVADYHLSDDGSELTVVLTANMYPNSAALDTLKAKGAKGSKANPANAIYRYSVTYKSTVPGATGNREQNILAWAANGGAPFRAALKEGSAKLASQMASDLQGQMTAMLGGGRHTASRSLLAK